MNFLHIHPYCDLDSVTDFIKSNYDKIACIRLDTSMLSEEMERLDLMDYIPDNSQKFISGRKITNRVFNNKYYKSRGPIPSPTFVSELTDDMSIRAEKESFLFLAFHYSIPVFINDSSIANMVFCAELDNDLPLISNEKDWKIYRNLLKRDDIIHYVLNDDFGLGWDNLSWFFANISFGSPTYETISPEEELPEAENHISYLYDDITEGKYGR